MAYYVNCPKTGDAINAEQKDDAAPDNAGAEKRGAEMYDRGGADEDRDIGPTPWATVTASGLTLAAAADLKLNGGVIADSAGTITLNNSVGR